MTAFTLKTIRSLMQDPSIYEGCDFEIAGLIQTARVKKKIAFLMLSDGSGPIIQIVVGEELLQKYSDLSKLTTGASIRCRGTLVASMGSKQTHEFLASDFSWIGLVEDPITYPLPPKEMTAEHIRSVPHLRARLPQQAAIARLRDVLSQSIRQYFEEKEFIWVATPILTSSDAEGAGERFRVTTSEKYKCLECSCASSCSCKKECLCSADEEFFAKTSYLTVSGQLEGEALSSALSRIYTFGPTFRAEQSHTSRHLAEFWMIEPEMSFATLDDLKYLADGLIRHCILSCLEKIPDDMHLFEKNGGRSFADWERLSIQEMGSMTYTDAIEKLKTHFDGIEWGIDLTSEHEKWLVFQEGKPLAITHYPAKIKSFYMKEVEGEVVEAMDILVPDMGELIGGSIREHDYKKLVKKMEILDMDVSEYKEYLDLRRYGSVPHGGFGLGFERLVAYLSSTSSVKDVIAYPKVAKG